MPLPNASSASPPSFSVSTCSARRHSSATDGNQSFVDRRSTAEGQSNRPERRQFGSSHAGLSDDGRELALAIDEYKVRHHRRYLTCDEMLNVLASLGYVKQA